MAGGDPGGGSSVIGDDPPTEGRTKRRQHCTICKNHNQVSPKNRHKCPYANCECTLCQLTRRSQRIMCHQQRLWRFQKLAKKGDGGEKPPPPPLPEGAAPVPVAPGSQAPAPNGSPVEEIQQVNNGGGSASSEGLSKRQVCDRCRNHDIWVKKRGHKGNCPYENCSCPYCSFTSKRQRLMKHQQRVRRAQITSQPGSTPQEFILKPAGDVDPLQDEKDSPGASQDAPSESPPEAAEGSEVLTPESYPEMTPPPPVPPRPPTPVPDPVHTCWVDRHKENSPQSGLPREPQECRTSAFQPPAFANTSAAYSYAPTPPALTPIYSHAKSDHCLEPSQRYDSPDVPRCFVPPPQREALRCHPPAQDFPVAALKAVKPKFGVEPDDFQLRSWTAAAAAGPTRVMDAHLVKAPLGLAPSCVALPLPRAPPPLSPSNSLRPPAPIRPHPIPAPRLPHVHPHHHYHMGWSSVNLPYIASALLHTHHSGHPGLHLGRPSPLSNPGPPLAAWWCPSRPCDRREAAMGGAGRGPPTSL